MNRPFSQAQFMRTEEQQGPAVQVGAYSIRAGIMPGNAWVEHESGEGADIPLPAVEAALDRLFGEYF